VTAGVSNAAPQESADPNPSRIDCRACHNIHTSYTSDDWALKTVAPVKLVALDATYDGGMGNLCANCHQQRTAFPEAKDGMVNVSSTHWGGHHGPEAALLLGVGGAGGVEGAPSEHYSTVENTCVACHLGSADDNANHSFMPVAATCVTCHADATSLDVNGKQTEIKDKLEKVKAALQAKGLMDADGVPIVGDYPEAQAAALWNYLFVEEDKSEGVHNPTYANALLDSALEALK
jgi:formate-dependent nitrite reductase cytochrome c552 subunit